MADIKDVTDPITEPLTGYRPSFADFIIAGAATPYIEKAEAAIPIVKESPLLAGAAEVAAAFVLSETKTGTGTLIKHGKTGAEVALAARGASNIVSGITSMISGAKTQSTAAAAPAGSPYGAW